MKTNCGSSVGMGKTTGGSPPIPIPQRPIPVPPMIKTRDELIAERRKKRKN